MACNAQEEEHKYNKIYNNKQIKNSLLHSMTEIIAVVMVLSLSHSFLREKLK